MASRNLPSRASKLGPARSTYKLPKSKANTTKITEELYSDGDSGGGVELAPWASEEMNYNGYFDKAPDSPESTSGSMDAFEDDEKEKLPKNDKSQTKAKQSQGVQDIDTPKASSGSKVHNGIAEYRLAIPSRK